MATKVKLGFMAVLVLLWWVVYNAYSVVASSFIASIAQHQLDDSIVSYSVTQKLIMGGVIEKAINYGFGTLIFLGVVSLIISSRRN